MQICITEVNQGGTDQGTWGHPRLAIKLAQWLSIPFEFQVTTWIEDLLTTGHVNIKAIIDKDGLILARSVAFAWNQIKQRPFDADAQWVG